MNQKKIIRNAIMFTTLLGLLALAGCEPASTDPEPDPPAPSGECPFTIYYALNESHGNSWVQQSAEGTVGIVYGVYNEGSDKHDSQKIGALMYRTIRADGSENEELVTRDRGVDKSLLVYDSASAPHIFFAFSDNADQAICHCHKNNAGAWLKETVIRFANEGGRFIYELSADIDGGDSFHLLALKMRSNPDSSDFMDCYLNAHLYHVSNRGGNWQKTLIHRYDTFYTYDMSVKTQRRQDIAVEDDGTVHVVFGVQYVTPPGEGHADRAELHYATNRSSAWVREIALSSSAASDDAGWYPSLCLDRSGRPAVASTFLSRVATGSVVNARLCYSVRSDSGAWQTETVAERDDGYYGTDGRNYTGALTHLKIDGNNRPHIVFSDIASSHNPQNVLCTGQIRYAAFNGSAWELSTIFRQPSPQAFYQGAEMSGQCLVVSSDGEKIQVIGQEMVSTAEDVYTNRLVRFAIK